jgi:hypothetical protein
MTNSDDFRLAVEALSGGKNTVILDDIGMPSVMVALPRLNYVDVGLGTSTNPLPAFADVAVPATVRHSVAYMSKYLNIIANDRAYSLPFRDPGHSMNFDRAVQVCRNKGAGWHLNTNALWAAVALWSRRNGTMPRGNNQNGRAHNAIHERGVSPGALSGRTLTGSGPPSWNHDWSDYGISDLNGNVWEWVGGMRLNGGEIQIIANPTRADINLAANSPQWQAIMPDGTLVAPGTAGTIRYATVNTGFQAVTTNPVATGAGATLLQALGLIPEPGQTAESYGNNTLWATLTGEMIPLRGGGWAYAAVAGVFSLLLAHSRAAAITYLGFRSAFVS